ncbi:hypothetical protein DSOUD_2320 [Desulfuromonas soudanensis]|uniref:YtkA-like domain-containing protein n=1 Tax=Desulfuromonas soudanensis TaxID=1603606 RepID=A0A0M3QG28_9BACT|nr:FixH family protein [Desulfuromonas soudanensis]ALC17083.1 hypothetical protein DSOUD_2320 [Desulfuromonas soudanensis]
MKNPHSPDVLRHAAAVLTLLLILSALAVPALAGGETRLVERASGGLNAVLLLKEAPLVAMTQIPFELQLTDDAGSPLTGASVRCDLSMPAMAMPINRPAVTEKGGSYRGEAIFTMAGAWRATFEILLPNGEAKTLIFDMDRVLLK